MVLCCFWWKNIFDHGCTGLS